MQSADDTMKEEKPRKALVDWRLATLAFWLAIAASLANLLNYGDYTRFGWELAILAVGSLIVAAFLAGVIKLAQPRLSFIFVGLICATMIDLNMAIGAKWVIGLIVAIALVAWFNEKATVQLTAAVFASVLAFQTLDIVTAGDRSPRATENEAAILQEASTRDTSRPPIIHLMLDAYLNIEGMQLDGSNIGTVHSEQEQFLAENGFTVFPQAYSQHVKTVNALPHMYSYGKGEFVTEIRNVQYTKAPELAYFKDLDALGYSISATTPSFVDFCPNQPMTMCTNYNRSRLGDLLETDVDPFSRAKIIAFSLAVLSRVSGTIVETSAVKMNDWFGTEIRRPYNQTKLFPLTGMRQLELFTEDLSDLVYGEARFIHVLAPHDPFMVRPDCSVRPYHEWSDEHGPKSLSVREAGFADNVRCLQRKLEAIMAALKETEAGRDAIVVVQGDHGARIMETVPFREGPKQSPRDLAMAHSAMFAVRLVDQQADTRMGRFPIHKLMQAWKEGEFQTLKTPAQPPAQYYLMDAYWIPRTAEKLPVFPTALTKN